jgi:flagellar motor component MotA
MKLLRLGAGFFFMVAVVVLSIVLFSGSALSALLYFFNLPSLVLVLLCPFGLILIQYPPPSLILYFSVALSARPAGKETAEKAEYFFRKLGRYYLLTGCVYCVYGLIMALSDLGDKAAIGVNLAVSLITLFYGLLLDLLLAQPLAGFCREKDMINKAL